MKKQGGIRDIRIAYLGGGSRGWAWTFMTDLAMEEELGGTIRLYDIDPEAARRNQVIGTRLMARPEAKGAWRFEVSETLKEALRGADFVVISILPGTFDDMESDVHCPERLHIYQSVGDSTGPGGIIRALRTIPAFVTFAEAIRDFCPDAWVINYTNPMSLCVKTLYYVFPGIKAFGCCHEVFGTQKVLKGICEAETGFRVSDWKDITVNVLGINHFTWFSEASFQSSDLFPVYRKYIEGHFEEGFELSGENWLNSCFFSANRVKMDLFLRYGLIAAAGDRHLAEFMPGDEYLKDPETVKRWKFSLTPVSYRKEDLRRRLERSARLAAGEEEIPLESTGEEGIRLIKALLGLGRIISNVNIPNRCLQISNLPAEAVVETNAVFSRDRIRPVFAGKVPEKIRRLIMPHIENHERTLQAALTFDEELVAASFLSDPLVQGSHAREEDIRILVRDMIRNTEGALPESWRR